MLQITHSAMFRRNADGAVVYNWYQCFHSELGQPPCEQCRTPIMELVVRTSSTVTELRDYLEQALMTMSNASIVDSKVLEIRNQEAALNQWASEHPQLASELDTILSSTNTDGESEESNE